MPREFAIPGFYRSDFISALKLRRRKEDRNKRDYSPTLLDLGSLQLKIARHFGFCFGVENAIELAYKAIAENQGRRIFLLSEMIHNPAVNADLAARGVQFLYNHDGERLLDFSLLGPQDAVIIPAFGTSKEILSELEDRGVSPAVYDATCPFVQRVWKRAEELGEQGYTVIIHGKRDHEETRATFSHSAAYPALIVKNESEAAAVVETMKGRRSPEKLLEQFAGSCTPGFNPLKDLQRIGIVNQTTMLASETRAIADCFRRAIAEIYGTEHLAQHFADNRDTLCYATYENQQATIELVKERAHTALVVGGYNSSNTSHLVELCREKTKTYLIKDENELIDRRHIRHFDPHTGTITVTADWLPALCSEERLVVALTSGASCPDQVVEAVIRRLASFFPDSKPLDKVLEAARL